MEIVEIIKQSIPSILAIIAGVFAIINNQSKNKKELLQLQKELYDPKKLKEALEFRESKLREEGKQIAARENARYIEFNIKPLLENQQQEIIKLGAKYRDSLKKGNEIQNELLGLSAICVATLIPPKEQDKFIEEMCPKSEVLIKQELKDIVELYKERMKKGIKK